MVARHDHDQATADEPAGALHVDQPRVHPLLQHLHGGLRGGPPLGLDQRVPDPIAQEAEADGHQQRAGYVLSLLQATFP